MTLFEEANKSINECIDDDGAPPPESITCPKCKGYGLVPDYSFSEMQYEAADCPTCGGDGWIIPKDEEN